MRYEIKKPHNKQSSTLKRYLISILGILLIVVLMATIKYFSSLKSELNRNIKIEELPIPEEIKEQGTPGLTKLNPDPEVKEEW